MSSYSKEFNEAKTEVSIILPHFYSFLEIHDDHKLTISPEVETSIVKTFKVKNKKDVYKSILNDEFVDLKNCYLEGFSYKECCNFNQKNKNPVIIHLSSSKDAFFENASFSGAHFEGESIDFSGAHFEGEIIDFSKAHFGDGNICFAGAQFGYGKTSFHRAQFGKGYVSFYGTRFGKDGVGFKDARFGNKGVIFDHAHFGDGIVSFVGTQFGDGPASFRDADFGNTNIVFQKTQFGDGDIRFERAKFRGEFVNFFYTQFGNGSISFAESSFEGVELYFDYKKIQSNLSFSNANINTISFNNSELYGIIDFTGEKTKINSLVLNQTKLTGRIYIESSHLRLTKSLNQPFNAINCPKDSSYIAKAYQWRLLKENFRTLGQYDDEDLAYVQFKRNELLASKGNTKKIQYYFKKIFLERMGKYGTDPYSIAWAMAATVLTFTYIYYFSLLAHCPVIQRSGSSIKFTNYMPDSLYHSLVTFLTIGYGDIQPANFLGVILSGLEGFAGLFLMSYFTVAFVRKVLR